MPLKIVRIAAFTVALSYTGYGQAAPQTDTNLGKLLELDLQQLMNISVASKRDESITLAPGIVTVVTAADIERFGYRNLRDILDRQTSMQVIGSNLFPHNKTSMRGVTTSHIDNNILIQLNGRPIREPSVSSINHDIYDFFPVSLISKIEIVRGPGSVLYGTNAFSGIINIITHETISESELQAAITAGNYNTRNVEVSGGINQGELNLYAGIKSSSTDGGDFNDVGDELGNRGEYKAGYEGEQMFAQINYNNLTINSLYSNTKTDNARTVFALPSTIHEFERSYLDAGYQYHANDNWYADANITYQHYNSLLITLPAPLNTESKNTADHWHGEITVHGNISDQLRMLYGATYQYIRGSGETEFTSENTSLYLQMDYAVSSQMTLIGGAQYNKPDATENDLSPRIGVIYQLNDQWGTKFLYSTAFREPSSIDRFIDSPAIKGDKLLKPETIGTFDAQIFYYSGPNSAALTYFHSKQKDIIARQAGAALEIVNQGEITYQGLEFEARYAPDLHWLLIGNTSYQTNKNHDGDEDVTYSPDLMIKVGTSYDTLQHTSFGLFYSYMAASTLQNDQALYFNEDPSSYNLLTFNITSNLGQFFNRKQLESFSVALYADNLLDEDIYFPNITRPNVNSIPHHAGRGFYLTFTGKW